MGVTVSLNNSSKAIPLDDFGLSTNYITAKTSKAIVKEGLMRETETLSDNSEARSLDCGYQSTNDKTAKYSNAMAEEGFINS